MSNLTVENLSRSVGTGNIENLMSGGVQAPVAPEGAVVREMQAQGMQPGPIEGGGDVSALSGADGGGSFSDVLRKSIDQVNVDQHQADTAIKELVAGRTKNIHETMLTIERADTSLKLMMQVRNKVLDAYREIMRMQV